MITIIDYKTGNLGSIQNMLRKLRIESIVTSGKADIEKAQKIILPGVGAFDHGMKMLHDLDLIETLNFKVLEKKTPVLGICLGMQLMTDSSEEGTMNGLRWIDARTVRFRFEEGSIMKVPHMGWNYIKPVKKSRILEEMYDDARFYFVHSYFVKCSNPDDVLSTTSYGIEFTSSFESGNIAGVQFHPEKSHKFGMRLLKNFADL